MNQKKSFKMALILGHPGHELRIFRTLEVYKPIIYILTDGSGNNNGRSRIPSTEIVLNQAGATPGSVFGRFTDREIYDLILNKKVDVIATLIEEITQDLKKQEITLLAGDGCEGFNPTHDLCRYLINIIATDLGIDNFEFPLEGPPHTCKPELKERALWQHLTDDEFERKYRAAKEYKELAFDLEESLGKYGKTPFLTECLTPVDDVSQRKHWSTPLPYYETYGEKKVREGKYKEVISFEKHMLPLLKELERCVF